MEQLDIGEILKYLPHRHPFLLIDRVVDFEAGKSLRAIKNVTYNEPFFEGHFPIAPIFPGVLLIEAMAQATAVLSFRSIGGYPETGELYLLAGVDNARFKRQVVPGDQLIIDVNIVKGKRGIWRYTGTTSVDGELACSADLMGALKKVEL
ncbi:MAG: 3-hydroxyacyl-ACP dehydratase FabZ [Pseudomonadota bacterium]